MKELYTPFRDVRPTREMRPAGHENNCQGHCQSIEAGGLGHWVGDGCGCDCGTPPSVPIDFVSLPLILTAFFMIYRISKKWNY